MSLILSVFYKQYNCNENASCYNTAWCFTTQAPSITTVKNEQFHHNFIESGLTRLGTNVS